MNEMNNPRPYRLGVALSGGGARGFAHVGALKALEEAGLKPDVLAGVSAGSIVAVLYSAGVSFEILSDMFAGMHLMDFCTPTLHHGGFFDMSKFRRFFVKALGPNMQNLDQLPIPVHIGAVDFDNGREVAFSTGPIAERVIASCSIPIIFPPVKIDGVNYVDGGVLRNMPSWIIRDKCERLIGVNVSPFVPKRQIHNVFDAAARAYALLAKSNQPRDVELCDMIVHTHAIANYKIFNLRDIRRAYNAGYQAAKKAIAEICWL